MNCRVFVLTYTFFFSDMSHATDLNEQYQLPSPYIVNQTQQIRLPSASMISRQSINK